MYKCTDCPEVSPVYLSQNYSVTTFAGNGESGSSNGILLLQVLIHQSIYIDSNNILVLILGIKG